MYLTEEVEREYYAALQQGPRLLDHTARLYSWQMELLDDLAAIHQKLAALAIKQGLAPSVGEYEEETSSRVPPDEMPPEPVGVYEPLEGIQKLVFAMLASLPSERMRDLHTLIDELESS